MLKTNKIVISFLILFIASKFNIIKDVQHPTKPKTALETPEVYIYGLYGVTYAEKIFPPIPDIMNTSPVIKNPSEYSKYDIIESKAIELKKICKKFQCKNIEAINLYNYPCNNLY